MENTVKYTKKQEIHKYYDQLSQSIKDHGKCGKCSFVATDEWNNIKRSKRVYMWDVFGLDWTENPGCHVNLSLYYDTHLAMSIPFATHSDAMEYVNSKGVIDKRIVKKTGGGNKWVLRFKHLDGAWTNSDYVLRSR